MLMRIGILENNAFYRCFQGCQMCDKYITTKIKQIFNTKNSEFVISEKNVNKFASYCPTRRKNKMIAQCVRASFNSFY